MADNNTTFTINIEADSSNFDRKINDITSQQPEIKINVDDKGIDEVSKKLKELGFGDLEIDSIIKGLSGVGVKLTNVKTIMKNINQEGYELKDIILDGVSAEGKAVKVTAQYNKSKKNQLELTVQETQNLAKQTKELEKQAAAQKEALQAAKKFKAEQKAALKSLHERVRDPNKDFSSEFKKTFSYRKGNLTRLIDGIGDSVSPDLENKIRKRMAEMAEQVDVQDKKITQSNNLERRIADLKKLDVYSGEVQKKYEKLQAVLSEVKDSKGLTEYINQLGRVESEVKAVEDAARRSAAETKKANEEAAKAAQKKAKADEALRKAQDNYDAKEKARLQKERSDYERDVNALASTQNEKETEQIRLDKKIDQLKELGIYTDQVSEKYDELNARLKTVGDKDELKAWREDLKLVNDQTEESITLAKQKKQEEDKYYADQEKHLARQKKLAEEIVATNEKEAASASKKRSQQQSDYEKIGSFLTRKDSSQIDIDNKINELKQLGIYSGEVEEKFESLSKSFKDVSDDTSLKRWREEFNLAVKQVRELEQATKDAEKEADDYIAKQEKLAKAQADAAKKSEAEIKKATAKEHKDAERMYNSLFAEESKRLAFQDNKKSSGLDLGKQISNLQELGVWTGKLKEKYEDLGKSYKNIGDGHELEAWRRQFELLNKETEQFLSKTSTKGSLFADKIQFADDGQIAKIKRISDVLGDIKNSGAGVQSLTTQLSELKANYEKVIEALNKPNISTDKYDKYTAQLKELDKQLSKITTATTRLGDQQYMSKMDSNIQKLKSNVAAMEENWSAAWEIPELRAQLEQLKEALKSVDAVNLPNVTSEFQSLRAQVKAAGKDTKSFGGQLKSLVTEVGKYFSLHDLWQYSKQFFGAAVENVKELDSAMIELKKVTDLTEQSYDKFIDTAGDAAQKIGTSVTEFINSASSFSRLGYNIQDAEELAKVANVYLRVGDQVESIDEASQSVISTMKAFGIEAKDAMGIVDVFNQIGNKFAVSSGDIGTAMQTAGAALASSNNTLAESIGLWTAMNEILQNGNVAATSVRFITQRMRNTAGQLIEMGEDAEGAAESITKLQQQILMLTGVNIMENADTFRSTYDVLKDISKVWDDISDKDQADVVRLLAGTRQASSFSALMTNFKQAEAVVEAANEATGSAMTEHARWMESIAASEAKATAAFEEFSNKIVNSDVVKLYYDAKTGILGLLSGIIDKAGSAIPIVTSLGAAIASIASKGNFGISKVNMPYPTFQGAVA